MAGYGLCRTQPWKLYLRNIFWAEFGKTANNLILGYKVPTKSIEGERQIAYNYYAVCDVGQISYLDNS